MVSRPVISRSISRSASLISVLVALAAGCGSAVSSPARPPVAARQRADLVVFAADIRTMDPAHPRASALAIAGGRIVYVGDRQGLFDAWTADVTISLPGGTVTPGLVDAHAHLYGLGLNAEAVALRGVASEREAVRVVAAAAHGRPAGEWLLGRGWDQNRWAGHGNLGFVTRAKVIEVV